MASGNKIVIAFLSVSTESSTDKLIEQIKRENADFGCVCVKLTQQDLQSFQPRDTYDAVVLLHSISQGRNSITDVADAKYSKLLPRLKWIYGPDRVAAVVHSMTSFNSNTKMALMMIFRKSQPTTFQCSKCVIQCNNLAEMPAEDLSRLTEFLGKVTDHPSRIAEDEVHSTLTTTPSVDKIYRIRTGDNPQSMSVSGSVTTGEEGMAFSVLRSTNTSSTCQKEIDNDSPEDLLSGGLCSNVAPTQPTKNQTSMTSNSSAGMKDSNLQNMASGTSQFVACFSDTDQISQASTKVVTSPDRHVTKDKVIDTTYPIALFSLSSSNQLENVWEELRRLLPGKTIMLIKDIQELVHNWHLFEAILVDSGSLQKAASYSSDEYKGVLDIFRKGLKEMLVPQNFALLLLVPALTASAQTRAVEIVDMITEISQPRAFSVFQYGSKSCRLSLFDDNEKKRLVSWLLACYNRYETAASQEESGIMKKAVKVVQSIFNRVNRKNVGGGVDI